MSHLVKLVNRKEIAEGTVTFFFEKTVGFVHRPGQYVTMTLINPPETDGEGNTRDFSIVSAPYEENLEFATRMRDTAFKRVLKSASLVTEVKIDGPFGSFTLHADASRPAVILAGGIGITPFMSMIRHVTHENLLHKITLFYSNRRPEDAAFLRELEELERKNASFKIVATMTNMSQSKLKWSGEQGHITEQMIKKYVEDLQKPIFYSAGPPQMVAAMWQFLTKMGVSEDNIRTEEFAGY